MSFTTRRGTRGARQPKANRFFTWVNTWAMKRIRTKGGQVMGMSALVLTTIGAKTGIRRSTPVAWFPGPDGSWLIVASAAGAAGNPAWYHNIAAYPDQVEIDVDGATVSVTATQLHGPGRDTAWAQIAKASARFAGYQDKTDRELPIIRLTRRPA
ncbi:nitroreductase/quinone reductase family protein [Streptosporangium amethystogenes subsp. fukuiense]|uniref:Nitroreductase/quinone reductase family protein n=1 Tax=Streptosporangium amethystogenes subsp. fukuiense TaxID=698418 RepID=A0ABW2SVU3_9ACTN